MILRIVIWIIYLKTVYGHGKLWEPPARSTMWRRGFTTPINPNDNELNCGGFQNQWIENGGRCGVCGDPYQQSPRENEAGGTYATGTITRHYISGQIIDLAVDLTANHLGYFEFRICPNNDFKVPVTQHCLDKYPIFVVGSKDGRYHVGGHQNGIVVLKGNLPRGLECSQCVIQWRYRTGNRWGCDKLTGKCGKGRGPQEEFYGCSDVAISTDVDGSISKPNGLAETREHKSGLKHSTDSSNLVSLTGRKNIESPVFDKLASVLWTLLQTVVSTNSGSRVALVQWNPIGHDIVELGKTNPVPIFKLPINKLQTVPSSNWPSKPTIVEADLGEEEDGPMMLSEIVVDNDWRQPTVIRKYEDGKPHVINTETRCHATKEFENVLGTSRWCDLNCNAGNCPPIMCACTKRQVGKDVQPYMNSVVNPITTNSLQKNNVLENSSKLVSKTDSESNHLLLSMLKDSTNTNPSDVQSHDFKTTVHKSVQSLQCRGAGEFASRPNMVGWCFQNCSKGFCPQSICTCSKI